MFTTIRDVFLLPRSLYIKVYTNKLKTCLNVFHMYIFFRKNTATQTVALKNTVKNVVFFDILKTKVYLSYLYISHVLCE